MKKNIKKEILKRLANSLTEFYPEYKNHFLCPTCMEFYNLEKLSHISDAHIIPRVAGGGNKTFLCSKCNSRFGSRQDKWFGEYIRLKRNNLSILESNTQGNHFEIDGIRVTGRIHVKEKGKLEAHIYSDKSSPESMKNIDFSKVRNLKIPTPLRVNKRNVDVGFLTAAYLLWFKELGYSWVLQDQLHLVREQIMNPHKKIIKYRFLASVTNISSTRTWIGAAYINGQMSLFAGILDHVVFLPVANHKNFYKKLGNDFSNVQLQKLREFEFSTKHVHGPPVGVIYDDHLLVLSDLFTKVKAFHLLCYEDEKSPVKILSPNTIEAINSEDNELDTKKMNFNIKNSLKTTLRKPRVID